MSKQLKSIKSNLIWPALASRDSIALPSLAYVCPISLNCHFQNCRLIQTPQPHVISGQAKNPQGAATSAQNESNLGNQLQLCFFSCSFNNGVYHSLKSASPVPPKGGNYYCQNSSYFAFCLAGPCLVLNFGLLAGGAKKPSFASGKKELKARKRS